MTKSYGTFYGIWWIKGNNENPINGTLVLSKEKATLYTLDNFDIKEQLFSNTFPKYKVIIGIASSMEETKDYSFKLYNVVQFKRASQVLQKNCYRSELTLMGDVNTNESNIEFDYLMLSSKSFSDWVKPTGIEIKEVSENDEQFGVNYYYVQPKLISLFKNEKMEVYIYFRIKSSTNLHDDREVVLKETPFLNIKFPSTIEIEEALRNKDVFERFFTIIWGTPTIFNNCEVRSLTGVNFKILNFQAGLQSSKKIKPTFENFATVSQTLFGNWLRVHNELQLLVDTFFTALGNNISQEDKFLSYCFSLELYHRIRFKSKQAISDKNKAMYDKIFQEVKSGDVITFLKSFLNRERDIHLTVRLKELFTERGGFKYFDIDETFIKRVAKTRNYYVHLDDSLEADVFTFKEIINANLKLSKLMLNALNLELIKSTK